jgi:peroxiredoxin
MRGSAKLPHPYTSMKSPLLLLACVCTFGLAAPTFAQAPKAADKGGDKKAPAPKTPADLAFDAFNKVRTEQGKMDPDRFQRVIAAGLTYLTQYPTHGRVADAVRDLAFFGGANIDRKQTALRTSFASALKLEVTNYRYKDGLSDPAKTVVAALDAAVADYDARESTNADNLTTLREKIDTLAEMPGGGRFLTDRERSYSHLLLMSSNSPQRAETHLKKLLEHKEKPVATMATEELNVIEVRKEPYALKFTGLDGKETDFAQLRGKVVVLYFWSSTNKGSTDRLEPLKQLSSDYRKRGLEIVTVSYDKEEDRAKLEKFIKDNRITWPVYFDGKAAKNDFSPKLNATNVPRLYLFDQKGILQTTLQGNPVASITPNWPQNQVEPKVKALLGIK